MSKLILPNNFDSVWKRVSTVDNEMTIPKSPREILSECINSEMHSIILFQTLTTYFSTIKLRQAFCKMLAEKWQYLKLLETEYFVLTGQACKTATFSPEKKSGTLSTLRTVYNAEAEGIDKLVSAKADLGAEYSELLNGIIATKQNHRISIKLLITRAL